MDCSTRRRAVPGSAAFQAPTYESIASLAVGIYVLYAYDFVDRLVCLRTGTNSAVAEDHESQSPWRTAHPPRPRLHLLPRFVDCHRHRVCSRWPVTNRGAPQSRWWKRSALRVTAPVPEQSPTKCLPNRAPPHSGRRLSRPRSWPAPVVASSLAGQLHSRQPYTQPLFLGTSALYDPPCLESCP